MTLHVGFFSSIKEHGDLSPPHFNLYPRLMSVSVSGLSFKVDLHLSGTLHGWEGVAVPKLSSRVIELPDLTGSKKRCPQEAVLNKERNLRGPILCSLFRREHPDVALPIWVERNVLLLERRREVREADFHPLILDSLLELHPEFLSGRFINEGIKSTAGIRVEEYGLFRSLDLQVNAVVIKARGSLEARRIRRM